jgi:hypothetical protein
VLIHLHALRFEHLKHAPFRLGIVAMHEGKTLCCSLAWISRS